MHALAAAQEKGKESQKLAAGKDVTSAESCPKEKCSTPLTGVLHSF